MPAGAVPGKVRWLGKSGISSLAKNGPKSHKGASENFFFADRDVVARSVVL
jgi:hypothetical protein